MVKNGKSKIRAMLRHFNLKDLTLKIVIAELNELYDTFAHVYSSVDNWVNQFKRGHISTTDESY